MLTKGQANAKLAKDSSYLSYGLFLAPADSAGSATVCPFASPECIDLCLNVSGRAEIFPAILQARKEKTLDFFRERFTFLAKVDREIANGIKLATKIGKTAAFRCDGTSDVGIGEEFARKYPAAQFYDYTKNPHRMRKFLRGEMPKNYHLTFSFSGHNQAECVEFLSMGGNVAVTFARPIGAKYVRPAEWCGFPTIDGDISDNRFLDEKGKVVALKAKGRARRVKGNPFVVGS
jgi:hypothetical protein